MFHLNNSRDRSICHKEKMTTTEATSKALRPIVERTAMVGNKLSGI
jgi:hypothetical protein